MTLVQIKRKFPYLKYSNLREDDKKYCYSENMFFIELLKRFIDNNFNKTDINNLSFNDKVIFKRLIEFKCKEEVFVSMDIIENIFSNL